MSDWLKVIFVLGALVGLLGTVHGLGLRYQWHPEWQRKMLHVALGLTALSFPWLFAAAWPVFAICAVGALILFALRITPYLRQRLGRSLHDVNRNSAGELLFVLAIALLFSLTYRAPIYYVVPLAILTGADSAAALIGAHWGRHRYQMPDGHKSWEGVAAFALTAFAITALLLRWLTLLSWPTLLLVAISIALVTTLLEAIAWNGLDNLLVPVGGALALLVLMPQPLNALLHQLALFGELAIIALTLSSRLLSSRLEIHTALTALLSIYVLWLGGPLIWLVVLLLLLFGSRVVQIQRHREVTGRLNALPVHYWLVAASF